ncbi:PilZ domain-containing protein [bacterium]|nr:PilZ domain-containing protein [bacterium]
MRIAMAKNKNSVERRRFNRFTVKIPVQCKPVALGRKRARKELVYATIKNISSNGILLEWPGEHRPPQFLNLGIKILPTSKPIECTARTVWAKEMKPAVKGKGEVPERYDLGLSFVKDEYSKTPMLISRRTNFYWQIFERTGYIEAYILHKGIGKECEEVPKDG